MLRCLLSFAVAVLLVACDPAARSAQAQVTPDQRKEINDLKRDLGKIPAMLRKKEFAESETLLTESEAKLKAIAEAAKVEPDDRSLSGVMPLIERNRKALELQKSRAEGKPANAGVSFAKDVAPIMAGKCVNCHGGNQPRSNLNLSNFAGWERGGRGGRLLAPGNANGSLLMARLTAANPQQRMPQNGEALSREELTTIATWINQGARFDGQGKDVALRDLKGPDAPRDPTVVIPKPTGSETVSFTRDIAPFMQNLCVGCHSGNDPRGGLSLVSFYDMMKGGDSGRVVLPGNVEGSRLFRLVGGLEAPRMPANNQSRITRKNYDDLKKWFEEGNAFDGPDPRAALASYIKSAAELEADRFAKMSVDEMNKFRIDRSEAQLKRALPKDNFNTLQGEEFFLIGNVSGQRLQQVDRWAQEHAATLKRVFGSGNGQIWKGRLAMFVLKDRFSYDEFNLVVNEREAPKELTGHSVVTANLEDAYVVLLDIGDESSADSPGLQTNVIDHLSGAFLKRGASRMPDWVLRGTGLALASQSQKGNPYFRTQSTIAAQTAGTLGRPEDLFAEGTFSPGTLGAVAYTLVDYMLDQGGAAKFARFIKSLQSGQDTAAAIRTNYNSDLAALARGYLTSLAKN
jgi:mono/diheme cytochrome c family protein